MDTASPRFNRVEGEVRFRKSRVTRIDPVFGELAFKDGVWVGEISIPGYTVPAAIDIDGVDGPTDEQRRVFQELVRRYPDLRADLGEVLWAMYEPMLEHLQGDFASGKEPRGAAEMLTVTTLDGIYLKESGDIELQFGFIHEIGWDDAMFRVGLDRWKPIPLSLDD